MGDLLFAASLGHFWGFFVLSFRRIPRTFSGFSSCARGRTDKTVRRPARRTLDAGPTRLERRVEVRA
uniref:Uncharacterized protein n=1 Tax=Setaria viridis TaxID=4556 RepID=A0A4V6D314_SETVI|nr:hypothetical protein SEVIR_8G134200v2 [Setaria viridis]